MMNREQASKENKRDYLKKGTKSQNQNSKNQIVQTIESRAVNESANESVKKGY
ncbi:hypothetical protein [Clostridium psychrophilum]|uniref:hypothetical protein n=1 Tax=Clostridium psychrophilum TaxID=132926 RepID=UPI001C0D3BE8|nr:hypothetical protein [Clostridium psychrophilum]MBU3182257.1 hypothetical protein [Clostridium psychrophilum]